MRNPIHETKNLIGEQYIKEITRLADEATSTIEIMAFDWRWYTADFSAPVAIFNQAIVRAIRRGVLVRAFLHNAVLTGQIEAQGIVVKKAEMTALMHAKMLIFDNVVLCIGSHNLTGNAQRRNIEVSVALTDPVLLQENLRYFNTLWLS